MSGSALQNHVKPTPCRIKNALANHIAAKDRPEARDITDWTRKGPLPDLPGQRRPSERGGGFGRGRDFDAASEGGSERGDRRRPPPFAGDGKERDFGNWERKGPLSPPPPQTGPPREGGQLRSFDGGPREGRRQSPAWGEGQGGDASRGPRREFQPSERPQYDRAPTAPELDNQWRSKMRPDGPAQSPTGTPETSVPSSPAAQPSGPATRPRLNLAKRTVSEAQPGPEPASSDKPNPFGAARPIDTASREKEIEEKHKLALRQKKEAEEKAREEKKAKEATEKARDSAPPTPGEKREEASEEKPRTNFEILQRVGEEGESTGQDEDANGEIVDDTAVKPQEVVREPPKAEGSWRRKSSTSAAPAGSTTEALEEDGWSTVTKPVKNVKSNRRGGGAPTRAIAS